MWWSFDLNIVRGGAGGEVCLLWNQLQPHHVSDGAFGAVHRHSGWERQHMVRNGVVAPFTRSLCRWFFPWALPHYCFCFPTLHFGTSPSLYYVSLSLQFWHVTMLLEFLAPLSPTSRTQGNLSSLYYVSLLYQWLRVGPFGMRIEAWATNCVDIYFWIVFQHKLP